MVEDFRFYPVGNWEAEPLCLQPGSGMNGNRDEFPEWEQRETSEMFKTVIGE